jgi:hypothetical protein
VMKSDPGEIAEILPIQIDRLDREGRGVNAQAAQASLQAAFERTYGCAIETPATNAGHDTLKLVASVHR